MPRKPKPAPSPIPPALDGLAFPLADLVPDPRNARRHGERNLAAVRAALERFGWRGVIVANRATRQIEVGHARVQAALSLGWTHGPVLWVDDAPRTAAAFGVADNRTAELAEWAEDELRAVLADLRDDDLATSLGFDTEEIERLLGSYDVEEVEFPDVGPRPGLRWLPFSLTDAQRATVLAAIAAAIADKVGIVGDGAGQNRKGAAITGICESWLARRT